jgi:hypothetical protein
LTDELALEGTLQDGLAEAGALLQVVLDAGVERIEDGEAAVDFGDDAGLLSEGGEPNEQAFHLADAQGV